MPNEGQGKPSGEARPGDEAWEAMANHVERMGNEALLTAARERQPMLGDALWVLQARMDHRQEAERLLLHRTGSGRRVVVPREADLGWDVKEGPEGQVLHQRIGPPKTKGAGGVVARAESVVHSRLAKEALDWLEQHERGGIARARTARHQNKPSGTTTDPRTGQERP